MERTRILYVIATLERGGAEGQLVELASHLDRARFEPHVCALTSGGPYEKSLQEAGVPVSVLGKRHKVDLTALFRLRALIADLKPDIVHTWMFTANTWGRVAAVSMGVPVIIASERAVDRWKGGLRLWLDRRLASRTDCVIGNSEGVASFYREKARIPAEKIRVIPNGRDWSAWDRLPDSEKIRKFYGLPEKGVGVGVVGRVCPQKGQDIFSMAVGRIAPASPIWFLAVGEGSYRFVKRLHDYAGAGRLYRMAPVPDPRPIYSMLDIVAVPSRYEGLSNVLLEAMACRCAVIASDIPENRDVIRPGENGWLVPSEDPAALAEAIEHLSGNADLRRGLGERARETVLNGFSLHRMVQQTEELYEEMLKTCPAGPVEVST